MPFLGPLWPAMHGSRIRKMTPHTQKHRAALSCRSALVGRGRMTPEASGWPSSDSPPNRAGRDGRHRRDGIARRDNAIRADADMPRCTGSDHHMSSVRQRGMQVGRCRRTLLPGSWLPRRARRPSQRRAAGRSFIAASRHGHDRKQCAKRVGGTNSRRHTARCAESNRNATVLGTMQELLTRRQSAHGQVKI